MPIIGHLRRRKLIQRARLLLLILILATGAAYQPQNQRRCGVHEINRARNQLGHFARLYPQQRRHEQRFRQYTRVSFDQFDEILRLVRHRLVRRSRREPLSPAQRLVITLRYLASGDSISSLAVGYRIGESTARAVIYTTCEALWDELGPIYLKAPSADDMENIALDFENFWNLPHCIGALDGKHVEIQCPNNTGSVFFNYKKTFSVVLMACCDARYRFTFVSVGCQGSISDGGVFRSTDWGDAIIDGSMPSPPPRPLPNHPDPEPFQYFYVGDEAFPLLPNLMRPFPRRYLGGNLEHKVFNYRLSRARRVIENTFGIMVSRFRIFRSPICCSEQNAQKLVQACLVLHNFILMTGHDDYPVDLDGRFSDKDMRQYTLDDLPGQREGRYSAFAARDAREFLSDYLFSPAGSVPWQMERVNLGRYN